MLATLTDRRFSDRAWVFERKLDGVRLLAFADRGEVRLCSRRQVRSEGTYPEVAEAVAGARPGGSLVLDGEVVAFEGDATSFERLQGRMGLTDPAAARATGIAVTYVVFDLLHLDGMDTRGLGTLDRKALLAHAVAWREPMRYLEHCEEAGEAYLRRACEAGWEGVIAKRADAPYNGRRSPDWLKLKCVKAQEFVIGGFTEPQGSRLGFGALLLGVHDDEGALRYAGKVGTGCGGCSTS
jgi:DNA ligase D-like protein (predicted ligase)